jgi:hypothetical protein
MQGLGLAIQIGLCNVIHIDQSQGTDARSAKRLGCPRSHAPQPHNTDMGLPQPCKLLRGK